MRYTPRVFDTIAEVTPTDWDAVCREAGAGLFMDRRLIAAVEAGMAKTCRFRYVIIVDGDERPVGCACLSTLRLDLADVADPRAAAVLRRLPSLVRRLLEVVILFCGLPLSAGQSSLACTPSADRERIVRVLNDLMSGIAREHGARLISFKEFDAASAQRMSALHDAGFSLFETPPMHVFSPVFRNLDEYCRALKSHYRSQILISRHKRERGGVTVSIVTDPAEQARCYTRAVHQLYVAVVNRAETKLETLTREFFLALADRLAPQLALIVLRKGDAVVAFSWIASTDRECCILFAGVRDDLNHAFDLYFNVMYESLDFALRQGVAAIQVGQSADGFKARLGCQNERRLVYVRGVGAFMALILRHVLIKLVPAPTPVPVFDIYRVDARPPVHAAAMTAGSR